MKFQAAEKKGRQREEPTGAKSEWPVGNRETGARIPRTAEKRCRTKVRRSGQGGNIEQGGSCNHTENSSENHGTKGEQGKPIKSRVKGGGGESNV